MAKADRVQAARGALEGVVAAGELERDGNVLQRRHGRYQVEVLEHDANRVAPEAGQRILVQAGEAGPADADLAAAGTLQAGDDHQDRKSTRLNSVTNAHSVCRRLLEKNKTNK